MKKTISLLLAIIVAAISICTLTICAFAEPDGTEGTETTATTATTAAETTTEKQTEVDLGDPRDTTKATETTKGSETTKADDEVVTNPSGVTSVDDGDETTKKPANVDDEIPSTGSGVVVPAIALLALAGSVAVAVKSSKKD